MITNGGWAFLMFISVVVVGVCLLIKYSYIFAEVSFRPVFFGGIYVLIGVTLILVGLALMKYVFPLLAESYAPFLVALFLFLLLVGALSILSSLVLFIHALGVFIQGMISRGWRWVRSRRPQ